MDINILFEDQHIIVAQKPPGVPSQKDRSGDLDMLTLLTQYLQQNRKGKEKPYIGLIHRLDRPVGGIMVFAKTPYANKNLSEQIRNKKFTKEYLAVVTGKADEGDIELRDYLVKQHNNLSKVVPKHHNGAKEAVLRYFKLGSIETDDGQKLSLLRVELMTGRHHQIRVQLSNAELPIWGDTKYNPHFSQQKNQWFQIALFAYKLEFEHPKTKKRLEFKVESRLHPFDLFSLDT